MSDKVRKLPDLHKGISTLPPLQSKVLSRLPCIAAFCGEYPSAVCRLPSAVCRLAVWRLVVVLVLKKWCFVCCVMCDAGSTGSGKTYLALSCIKMLQKEGNNNRLYIIRYMQKVTGYMFQVNCLAVGRCKRICGWPMTYPLSLACLPSSQPHCQGKSTDQSSV